jgi:4-amino-4-deoxychorismate lyase
MMRCWVNGIPEAAVSASDRGLQYGDGLFETMAVRQGRITLLGLHLARLARGCACLGIGGVNAEELHHELLRAAAEPRAGVIKLIVTRGPQTRGYRPSPEAMPTRIITTHPDPEYPADWGRTGVQLRLCTTRLSAQSQLAGLKHLNRLEQVLARQEWSGSVPQEGLMLDAGGRVIGGTMCNVFACMEGALVTPSIERCGVAGVMREAVLALAESLGIVCLQRELPLEELLRAQEIFLTNALIGIWPVARLEDHSYPVGPVSLEIGAALASRLGLRQ